MREGSEVKAERFAFEPPSTGKVGSLPYMPIVLEYQGNSVSTSGLLDTGATVNVLPYQLGVQLGADWDEQQMRLELSGNLAHYEAKAIAVKLTVGQYEPVMIAFAWTQAENVPLILGQMNFFMEFDVCFYRSQLFFEVKPKQK